MFNWLLARGSGDGCLVLRIEDTDRERSTPENVAQILDALGWLGLDWDEGPIFQSQRADRHRSVVEQLLADGHAYRSQATGDDVKEYKRSHGDERGFRGRPEAAGAVRLRVPETGATVVHDLIIGDVASPNNALDDPLIARADGTPLYNLAVAVDDLDAGITHVVRGNDHLTNTAKQLLVFAALGAPPPLYAHLPLLHGPDGKKLSKRHGAASVQELRDAGYLPEAVRNYIALLGWGSENDETLLDTGQLIEQFEITRVQRNPARFDEQKLRWMNGRYLRELDPADLTRRLERFTGRDGLAGAVAISQDKLQTLADFWPLAGFVFDGPADDPTARQRWLGEAGRDVLGDVRAALDQAEPFELGPVETALREVVARRGVKPKDVFQPLRVALAGRPVSPGIFETVVLLGRDEVLARIDRALDEPAQPGRPDGEA